MRLPLNLLFWLALVLACGCAHAAAGNESDEAAQIELALGVYGEQANTCDQPESAPRVARALALRERGDGPDAPATLLLRTCAAQSAFHGRDLAPLRRELETLRERAGALLPRDPYLELALDDLELDLHAQSFRLHDSEPLLRHELALLERVRGDPRLGSRRALQLEARVRRLLGVSLAQQGRLEPGVREFERALAIAPSAYGPNSRVEHVILDQLGLAYANNGHYADAARVYARWIASSEADATSDPASLQHALQAYGGMLSESGDCESARARLEQGIALERGLRPRRWADRGTMLLNLGICEAELGDVTRAIATLERARKALARELEPGHSGFAYVDRAIGNAWLRAERPQRAEPYFASALRSDQALNLPSHASSAIGLARVALQLGRFDDASRHARDALASDCLAADERRPHCVQLHAALGAALWGQGRVADAFEHTLEAERVRQRAVAGVAPAFAERRTLAFRDHLAAGSDAFVALAAQLGTREAIERAWALKRSGHGAITAQIARRQADARAARAPRLQAAWASWREANQAYADALAAHARGAADLARVQERRTESEAAEVALARLDARTASVPSEAPALAQLQAALPPGAVLLSYVEVRDGRPEAVAVDALHVEAARWFAFVAVRGPGEPRLVALGPAAPIRAALARWQGELDSPSDSSDAVDAAGADVRRRLLDPLALDARALFLRGPGNLARVNFAALPAADGRYLVETGTAVHLLDHESDVHAATPRKPPASLALIGAPRFAHAGAVNAHPVLRSACTNLRDAQFEALPNAQHELDDLRALWLRARPGAPVQVLSGSAATEAVARAALDGTAIVHFATHGVFLGTACSAALAGQRGVVAVDSAQQAMPLPALSALVLSDADRTATLASDDGLLTSEEIVATDLSATDWAVLSACETARGADVSDEGVFGLRRAFRLAGARTVITSLWRVDDAATAAWMRALYGARLLDSASTVESVRSAQLELLGARRSAGESVHPYFWAAFVASGDWR